MNNENLKPVEKLTPFTKMIMTIGTLPSSFYASMSYYESMVWLYEYLKNTIIPTVNNNGEAVEELQEKFLELKEWVETYTEETIPEEIENKLDEMAEDGTLTSLIEEYINKNAQLTFNNINEMKNAENITNGAFLKTYGYHEYNDYGSALYKARTITNEDVIDNMTIIALHDNTLVAELIYENVLFPEQLGAYGDGLHNDYVPLQKAVTLSKNVILSGYYKTESDIIIEDGSQLTINGINYNKSAIKLSNGSHLEIGSNSNVNELRLNNFSIVGDRTQDDYILKISYITNVMLNQINIAEGKDYLIELDHADIVFIDKCTFAGSNFMNIWQPCKGIKLTSCNPIYINNSNIWNLSIFIDMVGVTRTISLTNNWIEFVNNIIYSKDTTQNHMNLIVNNNNITWSPHGDISFTNGRIIYLENITDGFDSVLSVKNNNIIFYTDNYVTALVELKNLVGQCNVYIENNILFTRLSQVSAYALKVDQRNSTKLYYISTTNADKSYGCSTDGVTNLMSYPSEQNIKNLNLYTSDLEAGTIPGHSDGYIWYNGGLYIRDNNTTKRIPLSTRESIAKITDPTSATAEDCAAKLNILIDILSRTQIINIS